MATDNPKVSGYVPQSAYDHLMEFKTARGYASVSQAITAVLEEYFGLRHSPSTVSNSRLDEVEGKSPA